MKIDNHVHLGFDPLFYLNGWSPYSLDLESLAQHTDGTGIDRWIVFPFVTYQGFDQKKLLTAEIVFSGEMDAVPYRFENRRLLEDIYLQNAEVAERFLPFLIADPGRHPAAQVEEWKSLPTDFRIHGVKIQPTVIQSPILTLLQEGRCMLDYAEDRNLPFLIHSSIDPADQWSQCADILTVVEARPGIRFVLAHSCRFDLASLRRVAELPNAWFDCSAHVIHCECAVKNLPAVAKVEDRFVSNFSSPETVLRDLAVAFPNKLIWGSDAPFYSYADNKIQLRSSYAREVAVLDALPEDLRDRVCRKNTLAWLGLPDSNPLDL